MKSFKAVLAELKQEAKPLLGSVIRDSAENSNDGNVIVNGELFPVDSPVARADLDVENLASNQDANNRQSSAIIEAERLVTVELSVLEQLLCHLLHVIPDNFTEEEIISYSLTSKQNYSFFREVRQPIYEKRYLSRVLRLEGTHVEDKVGFQFFQDVERLAMRSDAENRFHPTESMTRSRNALIALCKTYATYFIEYGEECEAYQNGRYIQWPDPKSNSFDQSSLISIKEKVSGYEGFGQMLFQLLDKIMVFFNAVGEMRKRDAYPWDWDALDGLGNEIRELQAALSAVVESLARDKNLQGPSRRSSFVWLREPFTKGDGSFLVSSKGDPIEPDVDGWRLACHLGLALKLAAANGLSPVCNLEQELRRASAVIKELDGEAQLQSRVIKPN